MSKNQISGEFGEQDVVKKIACPNCGKKLMQLPKNYPLFDVQCSGCSFRAQVKTNNGKPKDQIFGAGWEIMEKVLKSGFLAPALIANFTWQESGKEKQKILFFPFIPKSNLKPRTLAATAKRANYKMFNYVKILSLPHFVLYEGEA